MQFYEIMDQTLGLSLRAQQLALWQVALRAVVTYAIMIVLVRMGKKRSLGRATAFDAILIIVIGSIAARGVTGNAPLFECLTAVLVLIALHWIISFVTRSYPAVGDLVKGRSTTLVRGGRLDKRALADAHMARDDLEEDLRQKGIEHLDDVKEARLERSGKLSVIEK
jgi:uncharacterized membrane protein YcaP (DUF421 family)